MVVEEERGFQVSSQFGAWMTRNLFLISNLGVQVRGRIVIMLTILNKFGLVLTKLGFLDDRTGSDADQ